MWLKPAATCHRPLPLHLPYCRLTFVRGLFFFLNHHFGLIPYWWCKKWSSTGQKGADLVVPVLLQEVSGHVAGQDVPQHVLVVFSQLLHLVNLLFGLDAPQEVEPGCVLQLKTEGHKSHSAPHLPDQRLCLVLVAHKWTKKKTAVWHFIA